MIQIITLIPTNYNDGQRIPAKVFRKFEDKLLEIAGGFSIDGIMAGGWMDNNELYRDRSRKYIIAVANNKKLKEIRQAVIEIGRELGQKAMYFEIKRDAEIKIINID
jgi:hypothetical protein